jgi:hypothetical protein
MIFKFHRNLRILCLIYLFCLLEGESFGQGSPIIGNNPAEFFLPDSGFYYGTSNISKIASKRGMIHEYKYVRTDTFSLILKRGLIFMSRLQILNSSSGSVLGEAVCINLKDSTGWYKYTVILDIDEARDIMFLPLGKKNIRFYSRSGDVYMDEYESGHKLYPITLVFLVQGVPYGVPIVFSADFINFKRVLRNVLK